MQRQAADTLIPTLPAQSWPEVLSALAMNETPLVFLAATPALLWGIEHWIGQFTRVSLTNSFDDKTNPALLDTGVTPQDFSTYSDCLNYELETISSSNVGILKEGMSCIVPTRNNVNEAFTDQAGLTLAPLTSIVLDDDAALDILKRAKIAHTMIPLGVFPDYPAFRQACGPAGLRLSVDVSIGDETAGRLPVEIASQQDWDSYADHLTGRNLIGRKPYDGRRYAVEMVVTDNGSLMAPMTEVKFERYWHSQDWQAISASTTRHVPLLAAVQPQLKKIGTAVAATGFRGTVSVEFIEEGPGLLVDRLLPYLSHNSLLAHAVTSLHGGFPIHLLHLQHCLGVAHELATDKLQARYSLHDDWSVIAVRHSGSQTEMITRAPVSGLYSLRNGSTECLRRDCNWQSAIGTDGYFLRLQNAGNYRAPGTLLGLLYLRHDVMTENGELTREAVDWIAALQIEYAGLAISGSSLPAAMTASRREDFL